MTLMPQRSRCPSSRTRKAAYAASLFALSVLTACSSALPTIEPATPSEPAVPSVELQPHEEAIQGSNPYEAGAQRVWSIGLPTAPSALALSEEGDVLVVATDRLASLRDAQIRAYSVVGNSEVMDKWTVDLPDAAHVTSLFLSTDTLVARTMSHLGKPELYTLDLHSGTLKWTWSEANPLDSDVPIVVGVYPEGIGVIKQDNSVLTAAMLDSKGRTGTPVKIDVPSEAHANLAMQRGLVSTGLPSADGVAGMRDDATQYVAYPSLALLNGTGCIAARDGYVCVALETQELLDPEADSAQSADQSSGDTVALGADSGTDTDSETAHDMASSVGARSSDHAAGDSRSVVGTVVEYDTHGHMVRQTNVEQQSVAATLRMASVNSDLTARALGDALVADSPVQVLETDPAQLPEAIYYDGEWYLQPLWKVPEGMSVQGAQALDMQAPFIQLTNGAIVNARTGKSLTSDGAIGYLAAGDSTGQFFEFAGGKLHYLMPKAQ